MTKLLIGYTLEDLGGGPQFVHFSSLLAFSSNTLREVDETSSQELHQPTGCWHLAATLSVKWITQSAPTSCISLLAVGI